MSVYDSTYRQSTGRSKPGSVIGRVSHVIGHTEAGADLPATATLAQERARVRAVDDFHRAVRGWKGAGYSTMPCASGRNHEMRGFRRQGAHTVGHNTSALAWMTPGHGDRTAMTTAQIAAIRRWIGAGIDGDHITSNPRITGHRDHASKSCPGNRQYPQLGQIRGVTGSVPSPAPTPPPPVTVPPEDAVHQEIGTLQHGDRGPAVAVLQRCLLGWRSGLKLDVNGRYNAPTREFVALYQERIGLTQTGVADPLTLLYLLRFEDEYKP